MVYYCLLLTLLVLTARASCLDTDSVGNCAAPVPFPRIPVKASSYKLVQIRLEPAHAQLRVMALNALHGPSALPRDGYGHLREEDDEYPRVKVAHPAVEVGAAFTCKFYEGEDERAGTLNVYGEMWEGCNKEEGQEGQGTAGATGAAGAGTKVAVIQGWLVMRERGQHFHSACDAISAELQEASTALCDKVGILKPNVASLVSPRGARLTGFLYLNEVHVARTAKGRGLSLLLVREFARQWKTRASVMACNFIAWGWPEQSVNHCGFNGQNDPATKPVAWRTFLLGGSAHSEQQDYLAPPGGVDHSTRNHLPRLYNGCPDMMKEIWSYLLFRPTEAQRDTMRVRLCRHFARVGFVGVPFTTYVKE